MEVIMISGGLPDEGFRDGRPTHAQVGDRVIQRSPEELNFKTFRKRVLEAAEAAGIKSVVFGGLPD